MPRISFARSALAGAAPGITQALSAFAGGDRTRQNAEDQSMQLQSRLAQSLAAMRASNSTADLNAAKAAEATRTGDMLGARPGQLEEQVALETGSSLPIVRAIRESARTGQPAQMDMVGPEPDGSALRGPVDPALQSKVGQALARVLPLMSNVKDFNPEQLAKSAQVYRGMDLSSAVLDGSAERDAVAGAQAAAAGKPMQHFDSSGLVGDLFSGAVDVSNPRAAAYTGKLNQEAGAAGALIPLRQAQTNVAQATVPLRQAQTSAVTAKANAPQAGSKPPAGWQWTTNPDTGEPMQEPIPGGKFDPKTQPAKPLPTAALKMQQEELDAIGTAGGINADLAAVEQQIQSKKLNLGLVNNAVGTARNYVGLSDENSKNLASFRAKLEGLRNSSLQLNKGVQTDGDAQRAWNELITNINDPGVVMQRIGEIRALNERAATLRRMNVDMVRNNYGLPPLDTEQRFNQPAVVGASPPAPRAAAPGGPAASAPDRRVPATEQRRRDSDRVPILQAEWLKAAPGSPDRAALERELRTLKAAPPDDRRATPAAPAGGKTITRRGTAPDGRKVVQYSDGSVEYAN